MRRIIAVAITVLPAAGLLAQGPASPLPRELPAFAVEARQAAQPLPAEVPAAQASQGQGLSATQLEQNNVIAASENLRSIEVDEADARALLNFLVQSFGLNLAMPGEVNAKVSLRLRDATLSEAVEAILAQLPGELRFRVDGKLLRVTRPELESRTLTFDYVDVQRSLSRSLSASATAGSSGFGLAGTGNSSLAGGSATSVSGTQNTDVMKNLQKMLTDVKSDRGRVTVDTMTGLVFATDFPRNLDAMKILLETMQTTLNRQVVIEAKLIEVQLNQNSQMGVNWAAVLGNSVSFSAGLGSQSAVQIGAAHKDFSAIISAVETSGKVSVKSSPVIMTLNAQPAVIRVGNQDVFFITTTQLDPRTGQVLQSSTIPATVNEGVVLDVTPHIADDGNITMNIHPTVTQRTGQAVSPQGNTAPITSVQEADTIVRIPSGQMIAIAGLISERTSKQKKEVPVISRIPFLGAAFRGTSEENVKTDLAILMSARVLNLDTLVDYSKKKAADLDRATNAETLKNEPWR